MTNYLSKYKREWQELEQLIKRARRNIARMSPEEISRLDILYRRASVHLAQVAARSSSSDLFHYLNNLVAAAHSIIYLPPRRLSLKGTLRFFAEGFARAIARTWRYHAIAMLLMLFGAFGAYYASSRDPLVAYALLPMGETRLPGSSTEQLQEILRSGRDTGDGGKFIFSSFLFQHNLKVGLFSLATGVLAIIPCVLLLVYNGMILGAFSWVHHSAGIYSEYWAWILPHGITELTAIVFCSGAGLRLGQAMLFPGRQSRTESLKKGAYETVQIILGVAGMLLIAATIESYLRQSHLSTNARFVFAAALSLFWILYFGHGFLKERLSVALPKASSVTTGDEASIDLSHPAGVR